MLNQEEKKAIIQEFARSENDVGSSEVQIALLFKRMKLLAAHLEKFPKDKHSRRGLIGLVGKRRSLFKYLKANDNVIYQQFMQKLQQKGYL